MFKKDRDLAERSRSLLKNKETKKLKELFLTKFPRLSETELDALIGKEQFTRIYLATKTTIYAIGDVPYFIDIEGRNNIIPTVQCLWRLPKLLRSFVIHAPVSEFVMNGADLMLPGLANVDDLEGVMRDEKMSIRVVGNPLPFAVGVSNCSWEGILANGRKGKALCVTSVYGDCLCPLKTAPNSGFGGSSIYALEGYHEVIENSDDEDDEEEVMEGKDDVGGVSYKQALKNKSSGNGGRRIHDNSDIVSSVDFPSLAEVTATTTSTASTTAARTVVVLPESLEEWDVEGEEKGGEGVVVLDGNDMNEIAKVNQESDIIDENDHDHDHIDNDDDEEDDNDDDEDGVDGDIPTCHETNNATASTSITTLQATQAASMDALMLTALLRAIKYVIKVGWLVGWLVT
jgi:predicted RNA-binding protein (TIGR00451 family)